MNADLKKILLTAERPECKDCDYDGQGRCKGNEEFKLCRRDVESLAAAIEARFELKEKIPKDWICNRALECDHQTCYHKEMHKGELCITGEKE